MTTIKMIEVEKEKVIAALDKLADLSSAPIPEFSLAGLIVELACDCDGKEILPRDLSSISLTILMFLASASEPPAFFFSGFLERLSGIVESEKMRKLAENNFELSIFLAQIRGFCERGEKNEFLEEVIVSHFLFLSSLFLNFLRHGNR